MAAAAVLEQAGESWAERGYGWRKTRPSRTRWDDLGLDDRLSLIAKAWCQSAGSLHTSSRPEASHTLKVWNFTAFPTSIIFIVIHLSSWGLRERGGAITAQPVADSTCGAAFADLACLFTHYHATGAALGSFRFVPLGSYGW